MEAMSTDNNSEVHGLDWEWSEEEAFPSLFWPPTPPFISSAFILTCTFRTGTSALRATSGLVAGADLLLQYLHACGLMQGVFDAAMSSCGPEDSAAISNSPN